MGALSTVRKLWWQEKKASWTIRLARRLGRNPKLALFAGLVALIGGVRGARRRASAIGSAN